MIKLILKGFIIGIGKIIPGVSGALLAISLGVYEKAIDAIGNFFKNPINNFKYLLPLGIGAFMSILLTSKLVVYLLKNYYSPIMLLFVGLISGGVIPIFRNLNKKKLKISNIITIFLSFIFVISLSFVGNNLSLNNESTIFNIFIYFIIGLIDAATMIIPGISGTAVMMLLGVYDKLLILLGSLDNITSIINNIILVIPYVIGIIVTILSLAKIISYLFNNKSDILYSGIIGFSISSIVVLFIDLLNYEFKIYYIIFLLIGILISLKLEKN